ncbi:MAG TPA: cytochrome c-type biogenesis protein CcmH [Candidatus Eisenbacteria bacterium]|nr:cytochrome c-type biogenesis protein CcmH [Candidatus Eisenbacteria bacterium]
MTSIRVQGRGALAAFVAIALAGALALAALPRPAYANESAAGTKADPVRAITSQLICPCSCGEVLSGCTCETGIALKGYVDREIKAGKGKDVIEAALIAKYGEVILGAPKAKGFNLVVWVAPFAATILGFGIATMILTRWVRRKRVVAAGAAGAPGAGTPSADASLEQLRARAEAELREMRE